MKDLIKLLMSLQDADSRIIEKRSFIEKVPLRIYEVDEPLKDAKAELEKIRQKSELLSKKKREREKSLEDINEKINKMKSRISDIKTNKEYQAHLKEIESMGKEVEEAEEQILMIMEDLDEVQDKLKEKEEKVKKETEQIDAFKKELDHEVEEHEKALALLKQQRASIVTMIDPGVYSLYMKLLESGNGIAVTGAKNEICLGCNMNMPPQLFVEIRKNEDIIQCPQCRRILYYSGE